MVEAMSDMDTDARRGQVDTAAARVYEEMFVPALFGQWADVVLDAAGVRRGGRLLDVGCGTGVVARRAAQIIGPSGSVVGLDRNEGMLDVARSIAPEVEWRHGVAEALPFDDASFDHVAASFALMFLDDPTTALAEMARVAAPGGRIVLTTWAAVERSPGYAAMVGLLDRVVGPEAAAALLVPFSVGTESDVRRLVAPVLPQLTVEEREGTARFESLESWVSTDIRGWTLNGMIDDATYEVLLGEARAELAPFVGTDGRVSFPAPALVASARTGEA